MRRRTSGRQRRASLEEYRETYLTVPKIRNRKTVFVSEDVRDELDAVVRRLGGRGMSVSGLLENLAREHLAAYRGDIEQWRKIDSLLPGVEYTRCMHCSLYTRFNVENAGGDFSVGGARVCFRIPENPCSPRPAVAGRANPLPPVADFGMKEVRTKKKKHMTNDVNGMKKKCGRPALGRTRKIDQRRDGEVLPRQLRGSQVQGREVRPESGGLYQGGSTGGHRYGKAYTGGERTVAQPGGNGEQPEPADKALAPDRLLQDKAADRGAAGKAEADHG